MSGSLAEIASENIAVLLTSQISKAIHPNVSAPNTDQIIPDNIETPEPVDLRIMTVIHNGIRAKDPKNNHFPNGRRFLEK